MTLEIDAVCNLTYLCHKLNSSSRTALLPHNNHTITTQFGAVIVPREKKERNYKVAIVFSTRAYFILYTRA